MMVVVGCMLGLVPFAPSVFAQVATAGPTTQGQPANDAGSTPTQIRARSTRPPLSYPPATSLSITVAPIGSWTPSLTTGPILPPLPSLVIGDGTLTFGGLVRFRYDGRFNVTNAYGDPTITNHFSYDTAGPKAHYDSSTIFGSMQYRFYGGSFLYPGNAGYKDYVGEVNFPMWAYLGYKLTPQDRITGGLNQVPFALVPYFGSSFLESLAFTMGIEEVYAAGFKYSHDADRYDFQLGFFPSANPNAYGISRDSARYSTAIVAADASVPNGSNNAEHNMLVARGEYYFVKNDEASVVAGLDVWHSSILNFNTGLDGSKQNEGAHINAIWGSWNFRGVFVRQDIDPKNPISDDTITIGGYDASYNMATHGDVVSAELNYKVPKMPGPFDVMPYLNYSAYYKDNPNFKNTERYILGAAWTYKRDPKLLIYTEGVLGRNDPYVGSGEFESGLAQGGSDNRWKSEIIIDIGYYF